MNFPTSGTGFTLILSISFATSFCFAAGVGNIISQRERSGIRSVWTFPPVSMWSWCYGGSGDVIVYVIVTGWRNCSPSTWWTNILLL